MTRDASPAPPRGPAGPGAVSLVVSGICHATFAFEVGQHIDLERCAGTLPPAERQQVRSRRRLPQYFEYQPPPLRLPQQPPGFTVAGLSVTRVDVVLYDFGAASVNYALPFEGDLASLVPLSATLQENAELIEDARSRLERLINDLGQAIERPELTDMVEDYLIFQVDRLPDGVEPGDIWQGPTRDVVARLLRGADRSLAAEEVDDAVGLRLSWAPDDLTIVDWNAALVCDPDPEETRVLLEFANVQLLELRHLDRELDEVVEQAYAALGRSRPAWWHALRPPVMVVRRLGQLQVDSAVLFERVSNAVKLVGDRFLGRVYLAASQRFHFAEWDQAIARKLAVTEGIYQKLSDRVTARRLEILEWIVILLIAFEVVFGLLR